MSKAYGVLAAAIVHQAVKDWKDGDDGMKAECERFFYSEWYQVLRELSPKTIPEEIMRRLKK